MQVSIKVSSLFYWGKDQKNILKFVKDTGLIFLSLPPKPHCRAAI